MEQWDAQKASATNSIDDNSGEKYRKIIADFLRRLGCKKARFMKISERYRRGFR